METRLNLSAMQEQQGRALLLFMVVVGYVVTFLVASGGDAQYSISQLFFGISFGLVYLILGVFDREIFRRFSNNTRNALFFSFQILLVFGIGWTLGPGGHWLIGLPLAGMAVDRLSPSWRWLVYIALIGTVILPIGLRYSTWETAFLNGFIISTAIFFVVVFSQFRLNEQQAREKAEGLARQLEIANRQLAEYASQAEELAATQERNRLAREIHDNLGHYLTIVNVQIEAAIVTMDSDPKRALTSLNKAQDLAKKGLANVRESVSALRVSPVENRSLDEAISALVDETQVTGIITKFEVLGKPHDVDEKVALALYRVAQEGLTNVRKHARASQIDLVLDFAQADKIRLSVRDNGVGAADTSSGFGLVGIRERIHLLGGDCRIETEIGKRFQLEVCVPVVKEE
jgi:signal transduction histidine kinase